MCKDWTLVVLTLSRLNSPWFAKVWQLDLKNIQSTLQNPGFVAADFLLDFQFMVPLSHICKYLLLLLIQ